MNLIKSITFAGAAVDPGYRVTQVPPPKMTNRTMRVEFGPTDLNVDLRGDRYEDAYRYAALGRGVSAHDINAEAIRYAVRDVANHVEASLLRTLRSMGHIL